MNVSAELARRREDFPILSARSRGKDFVYLDNGATSLKPRTVIDAVSGYYTDYSVNIHRGVYEMSERATAAYDRAREDVADLVAVPDGGQIVFTSGTTEAINMVAFSWAAGHLKPGDEILVTLLEHHSNLVPWQQVCRGTGAELRFLPIGPDGVISAESIADAFSDRTRIVAVTGMSNVTGYVPPHAEIVTEAHRRGAAVVMDGAQLVSHRAVSVQELPVDFLAFSAHKMCGPTGIGALYIAPDRVDEMEPYQYGGDMIQAVHATESTWAPAPARFEAGTPNIAGAIGFGAAARYIRDIGMDAIGRHETELGAYLRQRVGELDFVTLYGVPGTGICSFNVSGTHPHDVGSGLDQLGIAVRTGFHCAQPLMEHFNVTGTVRASLYFYNTPNDVDRLADGLVRVRDVFG